LLASFTHARAQDYPAPFPARPDEVFPGLAPSPAVPIFNNVAQALSAGGQTEVATPRDDRAQRLSIDFRVSIPSDPAMTSVDLIKAMARLVQNLNAAVNRQCEIYVASFGGDCRIVRVTFNSHFNDRSNARQVAQANVRAEFELTPPPALSQQPGRP
jgi:hypothetical protein